MKQYLDPVQTSTLIELGFPQPKSVSKLTLDMDMDTIPSFSYSIGELIEFLPNYIHWTPMCISGNVIEYSFGTEETELYYCNNYNELVDNLYDMCVLLKKEGLI